MIIIIIITTFSLFATYILFNKMQSIAYFQILGLKITGPLFGFFIIYFSLLFGYDNVLNYNIVNKINNINELQNRSYYRYETNDSKVIVDQELGISYKLPPNFSNWYSNSVFYKFNEIDTSISIIHIQYKFTPQIFKQLKDVDDIYGLIYYIIDLGPDIMKVFEFDDKLNWREKKSSRTKGYNGCFYWVLHEMVDEGESTYVVNMLDPINKARLTITFITPNRTKPINEINTIINSICIN